MTEDEELELFTIKTKFFREIPHPKLILKAINQVEKLISIPPMLKNAEINFDRSNLADVLKSHSEKIYALKTSIAHAANPSDLFLALNELYEWQQALVIRLNQYLPVEANYDFPEIKQSDPIDSYAVLTFITQHALAENQIKTYICNEVEAKNPKEFSILTRVCLQCRKIVANA